ncbi:hypothetical protein [Kitasatospora azatica]|uniref:hypothetical protein n=1 Tax=Kitasatospora azatica TaxID=58347 RepID=UPI00056CE9E5|nr:hypothetical protein [Kitasatospora azatica]
MADAHDLSEDAVTGVSTGGGARGPSWAQLVFAAAVLAGYGALLGFLAVNRGDDHWDRLVFLSSGPEAIVFAAAGLVFGTVVQRSEIRAARADAAAARADADAGAKDSAGLDGVVALIQSYAEEERKQQEGSAEVPQGAYGARGDSGPASGPSALAQLERAVLAMTAHRR